MPNAAAICTSFKRELLCGIHALGTTVARASTAVDVIRAALFLSSANIGAGTTAYSAVGEVTGAGYPVGGVTASNANQPTTSGTTAFWTPSASFVFSGVTIGPTDCVLLYNSTQANRAISAHTFTSQTLVAGTLTLTMPVNDAANALIQLG